MMNNYELNARAEKCEMPDHVRAPTEAACDNAPLSELCLVNLNAALFKELHHWGVSEERICQVMQLQISEYQNLTRLLGISPKYS